MLAQLDKAAAAAYMGAAAAMAAQADQLLTAAVDLYLQHRIINDASPDLAEAFHSRVISGLSAQASPAAFAMALPMCIAC
jgi:hypothetical protein